MEYILYKKNIPILQYEEDDSNRITGIKKVFNVAHMPPHLFTDGRASSENEYALCQKLEDFFSNRIIPYTRKSFKEMLLELEIHSGEELAKRSFYLSLSDQYWVCPLSQFGKIWWEDINFFTNEYDSAIGLRLVSGSKSLNKNSSSFSPDNTTGGELPKRWIRKNGINYLEKAGTGTEQQEPLNEVLATEICRRLNISHIPYTLEIRDENYFSLCPDIVDQNTEMVPLASIYEDIPLKNGVKYDYEKLLLRCNELGIPNAETDLLKIFLLDFIIANEDRHSFNISFLRDSDSLEWLGVAPVYDSGKSMFLNKLDFEMEMTSSFRIGAKPFEQTQSAQFKILPMEKIAHLIDFSSLKDIGIWYKKFLSPLRRLSPSKKEALVKKLEERITEAKILLQKKQEGKLYKTDDGLYGGLDIKEKAPGYKKHKPDSKGSVYISLVQEPSLTKEMLSERLGLSRATITRILQRLKTEGKIKRVGANKNGHWEIVG